MKIYNKSLILIDSTLYDCLGNTDTFQNVSAIDHVLSSTSDISLPERLGYYHFSVVVNQEQDLLFEQVGEALLRNMQKIEMMLWQYYLQRKMRQDDYINLEYYHSLQNGIKDGKLSAKDFDKRLHEIAENGLKPILMMENTAYLHNAILDELYHAEFRMIDTLNCQFDTIRFHSNQLDAGSEIRSFSKHADNMAFCIQDAIKAAYKALDITSKWLRYMANYQLGKNKIPAAYFSKCMKESISKLIDNEEKKELASLFESLEYFTLLRNEITHNVSLNRNRQHAFVGFCTEGINHKKLFYSELLFWDYNNNAIDRASGHVGFFTKNANAASEVRKLFVSVVLFVNNCLKYYYDVLMKELVTIGLKEIVVYDGFPDRLCSVATADLPQLFNALV